MTEQHECEWVIDWDDGTAVCRLPDCKARPLRDWETNERLNEYETLKKAFTYAIHLLMHADFRNGNTDPSGTTDEGEVYACRLMDKIKELVPQLYADILKDG